MKIKKVVHILLTTVLTKHQHPTSSLSNCHWWVFSFTVAAQIKNQLVVKRLCTVSLVVLSAPKCAPKVSAAHCTFTGFLVFFPSRLAGAVSFPWTLTPPKEDDKFQTMISFKNNVEESLRVSDISIASSESQSKWHRYFLLKSLLCWSVESLHITVQVS